MENIDAEISMEIGALMFSMEFHGKRPNPPCTYFPWKFMEKFPWNSMEVFHTGGLGIKMLFEAPRTL